jgi:hypothetical protein
MKKIILVLLVCITSATAVNAQKWNDLSDEQKMMQAKGFRQDNQKYLKSTLGLSEEQITDVDNVNLCFVSTLDRIDRYGKDAAAKEKYAKTAGQARTAQLDAIMGPEKRKQLQDYVTAKLKKASGK